MSKDDYKFIHNYVKLYFDLSKKAEGLNKVVKKQ